MSKTVKSHRSSWIWLLNSQKPAKPNFASSTTPQSLNLELQKERKTQCTHTNPKNSFSQICNPELVIHKVANPKLVISKPATNCRIKQNPLVNSPKFSSRNLHSRLDLGKAKKKTEFFCITSNAEFKWVLQSKEFTSSVIFCRDGKHFLLQNLSQNLEIFFFFFFFFFLRNARNATSLCFLGKSTHTKASYTRASVQERGSTSDGPHS